MANVDPSFITATGSAVIPSRSSSRSSPTNGLSLSNCTSTSRSAISAGGNSTGPLDSSSKRVSVCKLRFLTTGIRLSFEFQVSSSRFAPARILNLELETWNLKLLLQSLQQMFLQICNLDALL